MTAMLPKSMTSIGQLPVTKLPEKKLLKGGIVLFVCSYPPFTRQNSGWNVDG